jgi:hypothetical protein
MPRYRELGGAGLVLVVLFAASASVALASKAEQVSNHAVLDCLDAAAAQNWSSGFLDDLHP